jgi:RNA polymerase sigma factor for flagellar operon FliA
VDQRTAPGAGDERVSGEPEREPERPSPSDIRELKPVASEVDLQQGVNAHLPLVLRVVRQLARRLPANVQRDDLIAAGICGLVDSLRRNGGDGGAAFAWYARTRIRGAIFDELRAQDWLSRRARAAEPGQEKASFVSLEDVAGDGEVRLGLAGSVDPSEMIEARSQQRALARALTRLPERERTIVSRYYLEGVKLKDIGAELGVSEPRVSQLLTRALTRLRDLLLHEAA